MAAVFMFYKRFNIRCRRIKEGEGDATNCNDKEDGGGQRRREEERRERIGEKGEDESK